MVGGRGREGIRVNKAAAGSIGAEGSLSGSRNWEGGRQAIDHRSGS